ncbi:unnamed protein product [Adineta steineri]|uniref:WSC domain-containing protein n=1 Tax=Adineta steineri TaxID=433720 RepID=A0A818N643_9BILA|nr:unnamed protein product [Adineta steineri]
MKVVYLLYYLIVQTTISYASNDYLGCFIDQIGSRDLNIFIGDYEQLTPKQCILICHEQSFSYAAIQYGSECRCDDQYGKYGQVSDDECDHFCLTSEKCGGNKRNSVYNVINSLDEYKTASTCQNNLIGYQGCFNSEVLSIKMDDVNSLKECIKQCSAKYNYAGIMNGNLCYCGDELNMPSLNSILCNRQCSQSSNDMNTDCCGGPNTFSVYNMKNYQLSVMNDQFETIIRAENDTSHTTYTSSIATTETLTSLHTVTVPTSSSLHSQITSSSSTNINQTALFTTTTITSMNNTSNSGYSSTNILETLLTSSHISTSTASTLLVSNTIATSTNSIHISQSSTNSESTAAISSTFHTDTSYQTSTDIISSQTSSHINTITSTNPTNSMSLSSSITLTSIHTDTTQHMTPSHSSEISSTGSSTPLFPTSIISMVSSSSVSSNSITSNNPSIFSTMITTESQRTSPIISTYSSQITTTVVTELKSSEQSIVNTLLPSTNTLASSSTNVNTQTTMTAFSTGITNTTTSTIQTTTTTTTTTVALPYVISTVFMVPVSQTFNPNDINTRESIRQKFVQIINFAFYCASHPSSSNCTQTRIRMKRQSCSDGYDVSLVSNITQISNNSVPRQYQTNYTVLDSCNSNQLVPPIQVKAATDTLSRTQISNILGFDYDGDLIKSTSIDNPTNPTSDKKLWIIGAVLGPVAFTLLLIFIFCYLHYKCRPRQTNRPLGKPLHNVPLSARSTNNATISNDVINPKASTEKNIHSLTQNNPLVGTNTSFHRLTSAESDDSLTHLPQYPISNDIPMNEIRHQNDAERWRNKLRLDEKFQVN